MKSIVEFFLKRSFLVNLLSVFVVVSGLFYLKALKRDLIPAMSFKGVTVTVQYPGAAPLEVEKYVTEPIEIALSGISKVKELSSQSFFARSEIRIRFLDDTKDVSDKAHEIRNRIQALKARLPEEIKEPRVDEWKNDSAFFQALAIKGVDQENELHRKYVEEVEEEFQSHTGIVKVSSELRRRKFNISLDPDKLRHYELSIHDVIQTIKSKTSPLAISSIEKDGEIIGIQLPSKARDVESVSNIVLRNPDFGDPIRLKDISKVGFRYDTDKTIRRLNGENYLSLYIRKDVGSDIVDLSEETDIILEDLQSRAPKGVSLVSTSSGTEYVKKQLNVLKTNAFIGFALVLLTLSFFLGYRVALMTAIGIPLSYLGTFVILHLLGLTINMISLIAMLLIIGILVDDAIIISERYTKLLQEGKSRHQAAKEAALSVMGPVTAGILTTMIAFAPMVFVGGWMKEIMISIPVVVISALTMSWLEGFFILPEHLKSFVTRTPKERSILVWIKNKYLIALRFAVRFRYVFVLLLVVFFACTFYLANTRVRSDFSLKVSSKKIMVHGVFKELHSQEDILRILGPLGKSLESLVDDKDVKQVFLAVGRVWMDGVRKKGNRYFQYRIMLDENSTNPDSLERKYLALVKERIEKFRNSDFQRLSVESQLNGDEEEELSSMFTLNFRGKAPYAFQTLVDSTESVVKSIPGFVSVSYDLDTVGKSWDFIEDPEKLKEYGVSLESLALQLRSLSSEHDIGYLYTNGKSETLSVSLGEGRDFQNLSELKSFKIQNNSSLFIPIEELGYWQERDVQNVWKRINKKRNVALNLKFDSNQVRSEDFQSALEERLPILQAQFPGYEIGAEISDKKIKESREWIFRTIIMCVIGIFFILALQLQSLIQPLLVCSSILFGFVGSIWAVYLHGYTFKIMAMIGLLGVAGVAVNDSVIMVDHINRIVREKGESIAAIIQGALDRLRPVLLTTITTLGGLFPMAYAVGGDSGFTRPMALSMAWGLSASTLLTLFAIPVMLAILCDFKSHFKAIFRKRSPRTKKEQDLVFT